METLGQRILDSRKRKGLTQSAIAKHFKISRNAVSMWESGKSEPEAERLRELAVFLDVSYDWLATGRRGQSVPGLVLRGEIAAGVWHEVFETQDMEVTRVPVAPDDRFPAEAQYALRVRGNSVNQAIPDGGIIHCVDLAESGLQARDGDLVVAQRARGSLVETTVKRLRSNGQELWPVSNDPAFQEKLALGVRKGEEVKIVAIVIGKWEPISRGP